MVKKATSKRRGCGARRVVVALRMAGIAGQDKLQGVFERLRSSRRRWLLSIYRTAQEFTASAVRRELERGADGFIVGIPGTDEALSVLTESDVPTVVTNITGGGIEKRTANLAFVKSDHAAVGREAAHTLLKQGIYKCYAYVGFHTEYDWSCERGKAFRDALDAEGHLVRMFDLTHFKDKVADAATMSKWLKSLPKPCGILAACDDIAFEIVDTCRNAGIAVPEEAGIIGVNNDPILCENSEPRISSIQPDFIKEGNLAAELLDVMMSNGKIKPDKRVRTIGIRSFVRRESTLGASYAGRLVQRAIAYIERHALEGIGVKDVVRHLNCSRRLADLRFKELQGRTILQTITERRLDEVKRRLVQTREKIDIIAGDCGYENPNHLKYLFKRRFGCSMRDFRKSAASDASPSQT